MRAARTVALAAYAALLALILLWEGWLAPAAATPRPVWVLLKLAPLLLPLYGLLRAGAKMHLLAALIVLLYVVEGVVLAFSAWRGMEREGVFAYALSETALATAFFVSAVWYVRLTGLAGPGPTHECAGS